VAAQEVFKTGLAGSHSPLDPRCARLVSPLKGGPKSNSQGTPQAFPQMFPRVAKQLLRNAAGVPLRPSEDEREKCHAHVHAVFHLTEIGSPRIAVNIF
jgi:hypothetical protein